MKRLAIAACVTSLFVSGCRDATAPPRPAVLEVVAGDGQTAVAGAAVAVLPAVRVLDGSGRALEGVTVAFAVEAGGGRVAAASTRTGADGVARAGEWVLGTTAGANVLVAAVDGLAPVRFEAAGVAGAPALLEAAAGDGQSATVGEPLPAPLIARVADAHGNPVAGVAVEFIVVGSAGTIEAGSATTGADGIASGGVWRLGTTAGTQRVRATVTGVEPVDFTALASPGPAATLSAYAGANQVGQVGLALDVAPAVRVRDTYGNIVTGATVRFWVAPGAGSVGLPVAADEWIAVSDALGVASSGSWVLGTGSGTQSLAAELAGGPTLLFTAIAQAGPAAAMRIHTGDGQSAAAGAVVAIAPTVFVEDEYGNAVMNAAVSFTPSAGGAAVPALTATGPAGTASTSWRLGPETGEQQLEARTGDLPAVVFSATATDPGGGGGGENGFQIEIRFTTPIPSSQSAIFEQAAAPWAAAITGDLPDAQVSTTAGTCGTDHPAINEVVDDLLIFVTVEAIDGVGNVLGSAGPCFIRSGSGLTVVGVMRLDEADVANLEAVGWLRDVVAHEIGHVLGIGTLWSGLVAGGSGDPHFTGAAAIASFADIGGSIYSGNPVPIEDTGGPGTQFGHWRESVFDTELMTGWINGSTRPLSAVTIASLQDIGYLVDIGAADAFTLPGAVPPGGFVAPPIELREIPLPIAPIPIPARR